MLSMIKIPIWYSLNVYGITNNNTNENEMKGNWTITPEV